MIKKLGDNERGQCDVTDRQTDRQTDSSRVITIHYALCPNNRFDITFTANRRHLDKSDCVKVILYWKQKWSLWKPLMNLTLR